MQFKIGQLVVLDNAMRARVLGTVGQRLRIMRYDGVELILPQGDVALPGEDAMITAKETPWRLVPTDTRRRTDGRGNYVAAPGPNPDHAIY